MNKNQTIILSALGLAALVLALLVSGRIWARFDITEHKSWTISPVSKQLAGEIEGSVEITYFVSDKLKKLYGFPGEISDLAGEYVSFSAGKIRFAELDPAKAGLESQMQELGIESREFQVIERDEASFSNIYTGLLIEYQGKKDVIPFVFRLDTLEYELTNRIRGLLRSQEKSAGILTDGQKNAFNTDNNYQNLFRWLSQAGYNVRDLYEGEDIPDTLTELFIIGGADVYNERTLYRIDRYIQGGGKVFFALKSVRVDAVNGYQAEKINDAGLLQMVASYGVKIEDTLVLDPSCLVTSAAAPGQRGVRMAVRYPYYVHILSESGNLDHPVTSLFQGADFYWPSPLTLTPPSGVDAVPLFTTTDEAWLQKDNFRLDPQLAGQSMTDRETTTGSYTLCAALSGTFPSYWRDRPKPVLPSIEDGAEDAAAFEDPLPDMPESAAASRIIVAGDADFLMGNVDFLFNQYTQAQPNFDFAVLSADWLGNDEDILSIRSRIPSKGMLDKIIAPEDRFAAFALVRFINTILMPLLVLIAAVAFAVRRKKAAGRLQAVREGEKENFNAV